MIGRERILEEPSHHRDTEAQRTEKKGPFPCVFVPLCLCALVVRVLDCFRPSKPGDRIPSTRVSAGLRSPAVSRVASAADRLSSVPFPWNRNQKRRNHPQSIHALASFLSYPHMPGQGRTAPPRPVEARISSNWIMFGNSTSRVFAHLILSSSVRVGAQLSSRCLYLF